MTCKTWWNQIKAARWILSFICWKAYKKIGNRWWLLRMCGKTSWGWHSACDTQPKTSKKNKKTKLASLFKKLWLHEENRHRYSFWYLIFHINEWTHVEFLWESHAVVELDSMHSGVVKVKSLQLERQQVWKVQKSQTLCGDAITQKSVKEGQGRAFSSWIITPARHLQSTYFPGIAFLLAALAEVLVGSVQSFWLDKCLQCLFLQCENSFRSICVYARDLKPIPPRAVWLQVFVSSKQQ